MSKNILEKAPALDRFFDNIVAKSKDLSFQLYQKRGKRGYPIKGKYVLIQSVKIDAENDEEAIKSAENIIDETWNALKSQ